MFYKLRLIKLSSYFEIRCKSSFALCLGLCAAILFGLAGGCGPEHYKAEADEEVYKIIDSKWQDSFGVKANYKIRDAVATTEEISAEIPPSGVLSLAKAVEIATKYSRSYQSQKESLYNSALSLTGTRHDYERQWFGTFDAEYYESGGTENSTLSSQSGVEQAFVTAGGIIANAGLSIDWTRFLSGDPYTTLGSVLTASVTAPLLGNVAGKEAWETLTQAERNVLYDVRNFNRYRQEFVVSTIREYYLVLQDREELEITRASYERQVLSTDRLMMEVEVGQRARSEADRARQSMLQARNNLVSAEQSYAQILDSFKVTLSLPTDANVVLDSNELVALRELGVSEPEYTVEDAIQMALELRLDLANTRDRLDDTRRDLVLAAEGIGIQADVTASMDVRSPSGTESSPAETDYTRLEFHEGTYTLGLGADLPFDQVSERNNYRRALISMQSALRGYEEEVEKIKLAVRQAYRNLVGSAESYEIQQIGVEVAENRVEEQRLLMEFGRGNVETLLAAEDDLVGAQNRLISALVNHLNAKLSFYRDIGILSVKPDGMWEQRTQ